MRRIFSQLLKSQGLRSAALVSLGNLAATGVAAIAMIIFSRLLGPSQFGVFSALFSLLLILAKIGDLGFNMAVQREIARNKNNQQYLTKTVMTGTYIKALLALFILAVGFLLGNWVGKEWLHLDRQSAYVPLVFVLSLGVIFYEYSNSILQGKQLFTLSVMTTTVQALGKFALAMVGSLTSSISLFVVVVGYGVFPLIGGLFSLFRLPLIYFRLRLDKLAFKNITAVAKWTGIAIVAAAVADNLDVLVVQNMLSSYDTGVWSAAVRLASLIALVSWSLGAVLNIRVASYRDRANLHSYLKKAALLSIFMLIVISLTAFFSYPMLYFTAGPEFLSGSDALRLLLISTAILTATTPFVALFYLFNKPSYFAFSGILSTLVLLVSDWLLIPSYGLIGAGYARIATRVAVLLYTLYAALKSYQEEYGR